MCRRAAPAPARRGRWCPRRAPPGWRCRPGSCRSAVVVMRRLVLSQKTRAPAVIASAGSLVMSNTPWWSGTSMTAFCARVDGGDAEQRADQDALAGGDAAGIGDGERQAVARLDVVAHGDEVSRNAEGARWGALCMGSRWMGWGRDQVPGLNQAPRQSMAPTPKSKITETSTPSTPWTLPVVTCGPSAPFR